MPPLDQDFPWFSLAPVKFLGKKSQSIRALHIDSGKARLCGPFPELTWPLERLIAAGIALPAQASMAHLYSLVPVRDLARGVAWRDPNGYRLSLAEGPADTDVDQIEEMHPVLDSE